MEMIFTVLVQVMNIKEKKNEKNACVENQSKTINSNTYAKNKILFYKYLEKSKINFIWFRVFWLFGDNENSNRLFPQIVDKLSKNKEYFIDNPNVSLDYTHVRDAAKMIVNIITKRKKNQIFNICSGKYLNLGEIAKKISLILGKKKYLKLKKNKTNTKIYGSIKKLKENKCYVKSNFKLRLKEFVLNSSKITS